MEMTCAICWVAIKTRREIHTQHGYSRRRPYRHVCCRCLGHAYGACWKEVVR